MATVIKNIKDGKTVSFKFRACLGRDECGKQIMRYTTWQIPEGFTPSKAERAAKSAAAEWENLKSSNCPSKTKQTECPKKLRAVYH